MSDVTRVLSQIESGDPKAAEELLPLVYDELRKLARQKMAHEKPGQTLEATALVHEAFLRIVATPNGEPGKGGKHWDGRGHFFAAAAEAMRRILINRARDRNCLKRGGAWTRLDLDRLAVAEDAADDSLIALDEALERLARESKLSAELVKLRFFAGLTMEEAAASLGLAQRTADRHWAFARAWLFEVLHDGSDQTPK